MEKHYLVEWTVYKGNAFDGFQKFLLDNFPRNFNIWSAIMNGTCMQKIKIGHRANFWAKNKLCSLQILFSVCAIYPAFDFLCSLLKVAYYSFSEI